jgi:biotin transport system substrate-specific component
MSTAFTLKNRQPVLADTISSSLLTDTVLVIAAAALVGLLAQVSIPLGFTPVPLTGQTLGVLLVGSALGMYRGVIAMALYVAAGLAGVPWFSAHSGGWHVVSTPNFGYLVGFIVAAGLCGMLASRGADRTVLRSIPEMIAGNVVIYAFGVTWLAHDLHVGMGTALHLGMTPFIWGDAIKIVIASLILPATWKLVTHFRGDAK